MGDFVEGTVLEPLGEGRFRWLFERGRADLAAGGLIAAQGAVWDPDRKLVASGSSQLFCRPRPERFK